MPNDNGIAVFRFADGAFGEVSCTFVAPAGENTTEIVCEKGVIIGNYGDAPIAAASRARPAASSSSGTCRRRGAGPSATCRTCRARASASPGWPARWRSSSTASRPPIATAAEGRDVLRLMLACYESAEQGRRIDLP